MHKIQVAASVLSADFSCLREELAKCEAAGVDQIHLDIMDGHFVPNISFGPVLIKSIRKYAKLPMDCHLMIENPEWYIKDFIQAGVDIIQVHAECFGKLKPACQGLGKWPKEIESLDEAKLLPVLKQVKGAGKKFGITFNLGSVVNISPGLLKELDEVLFMSVNPGFSGQVFNAEVLNKVRELRKTYAGDIRIDGGVNDKTAPEAVKAGVNILVTASYFFSAPDPKKAVEILKNSR